MCIACNGSEEWPQEKIKNRIGSEYMQGQLEEGFDYASEHYFSKIGKNSTNDYAELVVCSVNQGFRRIHVASDMIEFILNSKVKLEKEKIRLSVLSDNKAAIRTYESKQFYSIAENVPGFAAYGLDPPLTIIMERNLR